MSELIQCWDYKTFFFFSGEKGGVKPLTNNLIDLTGGGSSLREMAAKKGFKHNCEKGTQKYDTLCFSSRLKWSLLRYYNEGLP